MTFRLSLAGIALSIVQLTASGCRTTNGDTTSSGVRNERPEELTPREPENIEIYFHPYESTFAPIAAMVRDPAFKRIDIAMYSMEDSASRSEIIQAFTEQAERIQSGDLMVRMIFQGYSDPCDKCPAFEQLGIDVRQIRSKDVHHKFGVFYGADKTAVMTGSGNWSSSSNTSYDENQLFVYDHPGLAQRYIREFQTLWGYHKDPRRLSPEEQQRNNDDDPANDVWDNWGADRGIEDFPIPDDIAVDPGLDVIFNSANFEISRGSARAISPPEFVLTNALVRLIDSAQETLHMATPRISLRPVYDALLRAAERGVKIYIMSSEAEFPYPHNRRTPELTGKLFGCDPTKVVNNNGEVMESELKKSYGRCCSVSRDGDISLDPFLESCSTSQNHLKLLNDGIHPASPDGSQPFPGHENMEIRLKMFTWLPTGQSIAKQMHAKFTIADRKFLLAGSFNYSFNSEYKLFENTLFIDGRRYPQTLSNMMEKFKRIWERGRDVFAEFQPRFEDAHRNRTQTECPPMMFSLTYEEIDNFLGTRSRYRRHRNLQGACL